MTAFWVAVLFSTRGTKSQANVTADKPNILIIMADDVGYFNVSAYSHGMMVPTPNVDRIAKEGILFTDHYAHPSCTPGRAALLTGQLPIRTGLTTVGMPGSPIGLSAKDPTLAEVLKPLGYRTAQFGKSHVGDRNEHLPTVHGFDEFYGNLYHLNTEEEPFLKEWPNTPAYNQRWRPRGVLHCFAQPKANNVSDPRFGPWGKQQCKDTGALDPKRMETVDDEFSERATRFIEESIKSKKPFFVWLNPTRMHIFTHLRPQSRNLAFAHTGSSDDVYGNGMIELDNMVGRMLTKLESLGVAHNTIVVFTTDNGAMSSWWPDGGTTPFRGEKATTWEGGVRVPMLIRWPARIKPGRISNGIQTHEDMFTSLASAAGMSDVGARLQKTHHVYIDGVNNLDHWIKGDESKRRVIIYYNESDITAVRVGPWKSHLSTREGFFDSLKPSALLFNLRMDPFERHDGWKSQELAMKLGNAWAGQIRQALEDHYATLKRFPPRQKGGTLRAQAPSAQAPEIISPTEKVRTF